MPELPEVQTVIAGLQPLISGRRILAVQSPDVKHRQIAEQLRGRTIIDISRRGKYILINLAEMAKNQRLMIHLRMTGQLVFYSDSAEVSANDELRKLRFARLIIQLENGYLVFADKRRLGVIEFIDRAELDRKLGLEPLTAEFSLTELSNLLVRSKTPLKNFLLNQKYIVGIGNIYAAEIMFDSEIDPRRPANSLSNVEHKRLHQSVVKILKQACECRGTTFSDYRTSSGLLGSFQCELKVFRRDGLPCPVCGKKISKIVQSQRSTFFCEVCQK